MKTFYNMQEDFMPLIVSGDHEYMKWAIECLFFTPVPRNDSWPFEMPYYLSVVK